MSASPPLSRSRQITLLSGLYAAQGLPFGFFTLALPVLLREAGWSLTAIGLLQFLALPWALKFLWAPVVDHHGTRRGWLLALQGGACVAALLLAWMDLQVESVALFVAVFLFNLIAATQDIVTDGLAVRMLNAQERGLANAIQVGAYRLGMILGGGLLLWVFARSNWSVMFVCMAALLAITTLPVWGWREPAAPHAPQGAGASPTTGASSRPRGWSLAWAWLHRVLSPGMLTLVGLIFCYRFGDQMVSALITPFVLDQGVTKETIALMKGAVGSGTSLLGAVLGGWLMLRVSRRLALLLTGLAQAAAFGLYIAAACGLGGIGLLWAATVAEGVLGTMASVALFALMMDAADPAHAGTDYTLLASIVVAVGALGGLAGGVVGDTLGYAWAFGIGTVLSALGCVVLVGWLDRHPTHERVAQAWR
ncbi:MAG TPA: MFS transporter [Aquabacterium sp.]|uniref:MFS transporter n=1 Tax=Aquabacterium sp. TaxID=1872578 RepID=UPI002E356A85|nr:MFS transporter [Aquabacterium sp.]HEX5374167.1 MFS transporter [Aquabacterium sp.]